SRLSAASTKQRPRHLTHRPCTSECKTSERACRRQSTGAPNTWQNCCGATSKDGLTESRPPESPDSETRRPAGKSAASVSPAPPGCCARAVSGPSLAKLMTLLQASRIGWVDGFPATETRSAETQFEWAAIRRKPKHLVLAGPFGRQKVTL